MPGAHPRQPTWTQHTTASVGIATHTGTVVPFRQHTVPTRLDEPTCTQTAQQRPGLALWSRPAGAMFAKNNGGPADTAYHPVADPFGTMTTRDTTVRFRMLKIAEIARCMAYPDDWKAVGPDPEKPPTQRDQVRLLGDGVTPPVLTWCTERALDIVA